MKIFECDLYTFGTDIRNIREEMRMTQNEFSKIVGVNAASLAHYESGYYLPRLDVMVDICRKLGFDEIRINTSKGGRYLNGQR